MSVQLSTEVRECPISTISLIALLSRWALGFLVQSLADLKLAELKPAELKLAERNPSFRNHAVREPVHQNPVAFSWLVSHILIVVSPLME